jgi:hypothetical protein
MNTILPTCSGSDIAILRDPAVCAAAFDAEFLCARDAIARAADATL